MPVLWLRHWHTLKMDLSYNWAQIIWATLLGWLLFAVLPSVTTFLGAPLIVAAGIIIAWRERVVSKRRFTDQRGAAGT